MPELLSLLKKADQLFKNDDFDAAAPLYLEALSISPENLLALNCLSLIYVKQEKYQKALPLLEKILIFDKNSFTANYNLGFCLLKLGKYGEAIKYFTKALNKEPNHAYLWNNLGIVCEKLAKSENAITYYQKALEIDPENFDSCFSLAILYTGKDNDKKIYYLQKACEIAPDNSATRMLLTLSKEDALREKILNYSKHDQSDEVLEVTEYLENNRYTALPYKFTEKYIGRNVPTYYDAALDMVYVVENDIKLYFKRGWTQEMVIDNYNGLAMEQDELSPHRYVTSEIPIVGTIPSVVTSSGFTVNSGDVVVDLGVAEGNFAFSVLDTASKIYLFECDEGWRRALEATFKDYNDKVVIVPKYVSDVDDEQNISLDTYFSSDEVVNFIKADIEGYEWRALQGMKKTLIRNTDIRAAVCTYHYPNDSEQFREFFSGLGFEAGFTRGYLLFNVFDNDPPHLRRGVLRAQKSGGAK